MIDINLTPSMITLNVNGANVTTPKWAEIVRQNENKRHNSMLFIRDALYKNTQIESERREKAFHQNTNPKKADVTIL